MNSRVFARPSELKVTTPCPSFRLLYVWKLGPATLEFWDRFQNERNQGKQAHPVLKYLVPHGSQINTHTHPGFLTGPSAPCVA